MGIIEDGALLVVDGLIFAVGQGRRVENLAPARYAIEVDASRCIVLPGFVDSHTQLVAGQRSPADSEPLAGVQRLQELTLRAGVNPRTVRDLRLTPSRTLARGGRLLLESFVRHGTTTVEAKTGYGLDRRGELKTLRALARLSAAPVDLIPTFFGAAAAPTEYEDRRHEYVDWMIGNMLPFVAQKRLARMAAVRCGKGAFSLDDARRYLEAARGLGLGLKVQTDQFAHAGAARLAVEMGAAAVEHLDYAGADDVSVLAQSSTIATLIPGPAHFLDLKRHAPARALIARGAAVALASGFNPDTSPSCSMQMAIALACSQMHFTPAEAVTAATINGAYAAGCAARVGSLEAGKQADVVILDVPDYREIPRRFGENLTVMTMKKGHILYSRGEVLCPQN
jgi:imidazolonepropionase